MPEPTSALQRLQAKVNGQDANGELFRVDDVKVVPSDTDTEVRIDLVMSPSLAANLQRLLAAPKLHDPDCTPGRRSITVNGEKFEIEFQASLPDRQTNPADRAVRWSSIEGKRREKPNAPKPDVPDR